MGETILAQNIYCTKHNPNPDSQFGSLVCKRLGTWAPHSTYKYYLTTVIAIQLLTQPLMCEMDSSILVATSWLKVVSTTWASLPIIPSTERTNREFFSVGLGRDVRAYPSSIFPTEEKVCLFPLYSTTLRQHLQTWFQFTLLSGSPISPGYTHHLGFLQYYPHGAPPPLIW